MNPRLQARPLDVKRRVPVPFAQRIRDDGTADFAVVDGTTVLRCARERLCGLCGQELEYWLAFIGGPASMTNRVFVDPPMHPECGQDAFTLCPHIARPLVPRRPGGEGGVPVGWADNRVRRWGMGITRQFTWRVVPITGGGRGPQFTAAAFKTIRWWEYVDGLAVEVRG